MSSPFWWGDWRPSLTPHTGNLQPTDLIECTSIVGGSPVNTAITGAQIIAAAGGGGLTVGTTAIASGTNGRVLFQDAGVLQQDASFFWDNTNKRLGVGATPSTDVRLDVRAQGALSTDIAFRVRNSANTANFFDIQGDGRYRLGDANGGLNNSFSYISDGRLFMAKSGSNFIEFNNSGQNRIWNPAGGWAITGNSTITTQAASGSSGSGSFYWFAGTMQVGGVLAATGGASNSFWVSNGVAPSTNFADRHWYYSADIVAGNAAPHFRTENGDIVKLYRVGGWGLPTGTFTRTTFNTATVTTAQLAERVAALIQDLRDNHQLLKA